MAWNYHRDAQGRNVYQVNVNSPPHHHHNHIHGPNSANDYCMCNMHARNSVSLSSLSSLNLSTPSGSPSPPGGGIANQNMENSGPLMLSMQYSNNNLSQQHQYSSHQHGLRSRYNLKHNSSNHHKRNRRLSGTFIPEHHLITVPPSQTAKNVSPISNPVEMFVPRKNNLEKLH